MDNNQAEIPELPPPVRIWGPVPVLSRPGVPLGTQALLLAREGRRWRHNVSPRRYQWAKGAYFARRGHESDELMRRCVIMQQVGKVAAFIGLSHRLDEDAAVTAGVRLADLLISYPDTDEMALEVAETLLRSGAVALVAIDAQGLRGTRIYQALSRYGAAVAVGSQHY